MLSGERAFTGETTADTLTAILTNDPEEMSRPGRVDYLLTPDGEGYAYTYGRALTDLHLLEGLEF